MCIIRIYTLRTIYNLYKTLKCYFCVGYIAQTSNVTEKHTSNISIPQASKTIDHIDPFSKEEPNTKKLHSDVTKTPISDTSHQSHDQSDTKKIPSKRLKTEENITFKNNPYEDIILWEKPGDNPQAILSNSASISGVHLEWKYTQKQDNW